MKSGFKIKGREIIDESSSFYSAIHNINVYSILEISVSVKIEINNSDIFIDFQTTTISEGEYSTELYPYLDGDFELEDLNEDEDVAKQIIKEIMQKGEIQKMYNDYIESNFDMVEIGIFCTDRQSRFFEATRQI